MRAVIFVFALPVALGVIHNLDLRSKDEQIEPIPMDIPNEMDLSEIAEDVLRPDFFS